MRTLAASAACTAFATSACGSSGARSTSSPAAKGPTVAVKRTWQLGQSLSGGRAIQVFYMPAGCEALGPARATTTQTSRSVVVHLVEPIRRLPAGEGCAASASSGGFNPEPGVPLTATIHLRAKLDGRTVLGGSPGSFSYSRGQQKRVPEVLGFSPRQAAHLLRQQGIDAHVLDPTGRQVVRQTPAAGQPVNGVPVMVVGGK